MVFPSRQPTGLTIEIEAELSYGRPTRCALSLDAPSLSAHPAEERPTLLRRGLSGLYERPQWALAPASRDLTHPYMSMHTWHVFMHAITACVRLYCVRARHASTRPMHAPASRPGGCTHACARLMRPAGQWPSKQASAASSTDACYPGGATYRDPPQRSRGHCHRQRCAAERTKYRQASAKAQS